MGRVVSEYRTTFCPALVAKRLSNKRTAHYGTWEVCKHSGIFIDMVKSMGKWYRCSEKIVPEKVCCNLVYILRGGGPSDKVTILASTHPPPQDPQVYHLPFTPPFLIHSLPKETHLFWSCFSFGEECIPMNLGSYTIIKTLCQGQWPRGTRKNGHIKVSFLLEKSVGP